MSAIVGGNLFEDPEHVLQAIDSIDYRGSVPPSLGIAKEGFYVAHKELKIQKRPLVPPGWSVALDGLLWDDPNDFFKGYQERGDLFIDTLQGMFSFCMFGQDYPYVYFGRDWVGCVPLYYIMRGGRIAFASEMKVLVQQLGALGSEIKPFPPGHYSLYDLEKGSLEHRTYYTLPVYPRVSDPPDVISLNIRAMLEDSIRRQVRWDVPVCVLLSGGIDSVVVAYLVKKYIPNLEGMVISVGDNPKAKDDLKFARLSAEFLGIPLHQLILDRATVEGMLEVGILVAEDPKVSMVSTAIPMTLLGEHAGSMGFKIAFTGEGSDGLWGSFGHIQAWFKESDRFKTARHKLVTNGYKTNIARTNKALLYGGGVQAMFPFLYRPLAEYSLGIDPQYMNETLPVYRRVMKPLFRHAFKGEIPDELLYRKKKTLQDGSHVERIVESIGEEELRSLYEKRFPSVEPVETLFSGR